MQPNFYPKSVHGIARSDVDYHAVEIIDRLQSAGYEAYLVGGGVRDLLLGHKPKDFDISTAAEPEEIKRLFRNCILIGRRFRLAHIRFGRKVFEVSTFRKGETASDELITRDNEWGTAEEDVLRRDFTINGLYYNPATEEVIDYVEGFEDIKKERLHCIGEPQVRFKQDPVRMIRLLKFEARFGLNVDHKLRNALLECRSEITKSSQARILEELFRMLESHASAPFFQLMTDHGLLAHLLPTLSDFLETEAGSEVYTYLEEIDHMFRENPKLRIERCILIAALTFPFFHGEIHSHFGHLTKPPHLGQVHDFARDYSRDLWGPFFQIPRRMSAELINILTTQLRFTPLKPATRKNTHRIPRSSDFLLALKFLNLRQRINPELAPIFDEWRSSYQRRRR